MCRMNEGPHMHFANAPLPSNFVPGKLRRISRDAGPGRDLAVRFDRSVTGRVINIHPFPCYIVAILMLRLVAVFLRVLLLTNGPFK